MECSGVESVRGMTEQAEQSRCDGVLCVLCATLKLTLFEQPEPQAKYNKFHQQSLSVLLAAFFSLVVEAHLVLVCLSHRRRQRSTP